MQKNTLRTTLITLSLAFTLWSHPVQAGLDEGTVAYNKGDFATAIKEWKRLATGGSAPAQHNLGVMYANGKGVPQDYQEAARWYRLAANQGYVSAQNDLGLMYAKGQGVPQDGKEAGRWFRLAAAQGDVLAKFNLGVMHYKGQGVPQNYKEAVRWYRLAANQGHADAQNNLGVMYAFGQGVPENLVVAYALSNVSAAADPSDTNPTLRLRTDLAKEMSLQEINTAQDLSLKLSQPGNFLKALDAYTQTLGNSK